MSILERVKRICLSPQTEWQVIAGETTPAAGLITGYVLPLAIIGAIAAFIGGSLVGQSLPFVGTYRIPLLTGLSIAIVSVVMAVCGVVLLAIIINALAPTFGAQRNSSQAFKVAVYSITPAWVAGVLQILPALGLLVIVGALYGLYLLYLGLPRLMKCPAEKAIGYTVVVVICGIVMSVVLGAVGGLVTGQGLFGGGALSAGNAGTSDVQFDPDSPLGKLEQLGEQLEQTAAKADAAAKSGDQAGQAAAAIEGLGALFGGGRRVDPLDIEVLKPLVPATFAGLPRTSNTAEKTGLGIIMVSKAEATYSDGGERSVRLEVVDSGGASGLMGLASWMNVQGERESEDEVERTQRVGGRLVHEKISKRGGSNEFAIVIGERFLVNAEGQGVDAAALKAAVSSLDLEKLESMKDVGVQK